ncbi:PWWP domain [Arabidopsis thaliana x Arabidopsis arenosa]|uniref:PWWP domain n=1 Tax=Arabidopsis thaliana x Arabidopsis arenosa TaxID=1240361 RepID=A0A8T1YDJ6_9BRAS|nr:PWWP domain [Arabidopsis thaliana x Arabidopsis arenosa]
MEMEVVLGSGEDARPKPCSSEIESAEKTLKDDVGVQENGVRVSENGEKKSDVVDDDEKTVKNLNESGVIEDCVMNGVSSLLKLKEDVEEEEEDEEEDDDDEEEEEEHGYCVGDFVWGKIKNHPWWPGQIYDPSDASDLALKIKQKGKLLVACFGDGTFAWCGASQLKPFAESFKECSKVSNSRGFLGAVEEAVEEIGRQIERVLVCDCAEVKYKFDSPVVNNAGIKEGVLVRDVRREMISSLLVGKHGEILKDVKSFAETVSFSGLLELEILKRKVSAFYRSNRGYGLTEYHEPQSVPGLEDKNNDDDDDVEDENVNDGLEWRAKRSSIEEAADLDHEESSLQRSLEKCSGFPDHRLPHRRKQKSITEIIENESAAKVRFETEPTDGDVKSNVKSGRKKTKCHDDVNGDLENVTATAPRRRRKSEVATIEDAGHKQAVESSKGKTSRKKKKMDVDDDGSVDREETEEKEISDLEIDIDSTPLASLRKRVRFDDSNVERSAENGETATQTSKRERKKSKYLSPDYLSDFSRKGRKKSTIESESSKVSSQSQVGERMTNASDSLVAVEEDMLDKPCEPSSDNGLGHEELSEELSNAVDFLRLGATPKEMQDLIRVAALGTQYPNDSSSRDMVREFMTIYRSFTYHDGANHKFLGSYDSSDKEKEELNEMGKHVVTKGKEKKDKKRKAKEQAEEIEVTGKEENETDKHGKTKKERKRKKSESKKEGDEGEETQKEAIESTKKERKLKKSESKKQADGEEETQKEPSESTKKERERKKPESKKKAEAVEEEETPKDSVESTKKERKRKKPNHDKEEVPNETEKPEKKKKKREGKSKKKETEKEFSGAELYVTFGPGSSLPKKEDLIEIYEKFGALDKERTDMVDNNFSARVAFLDVADGEKAFESSLEKCPFTSNSTVKFRLKYPNERTEEKKTEAEVAETTMEVGYLKKKLEEMKMLLDGCEGGMTEEVKVKLEGEMVNLLEKVRK